MDASVSGHATLDARIAQWREFLRRRQTLHTVDIAELEDHLRELIDSLIAGGLTADEAFLVAVKRMGAQDALSAEFAREHSDRLWKQLVAVPDGEPSERGTREALMAFGCAVGAAALAKLPALFGIDLKTHESFYLRHASFFVLPVMAGFFAWKRQLPAATIRWLAAAFVLALVVMNTLPFTPAGNTEILASLHLPIALWLAVGIAYAGPRFREVAGRMDFIRFSGELFIYFVLIALGGGLLMAISANIFQAIGIDIEPFFEEWIAPCGPTGALIVAAWLVEAKQSVVENMAPVLTRLFTPLFTIALFFFLGAVIWTGQGLSMERDTLLVFDLLLAVVVALLLYSLSARDPHAPPGPFDVLQLVLVLAALATDIVALAAITNRIDQYGFSPNRVAALGENLLLLVNLGGSAVLSLRFLLKEGTFARLERWQTDFLPVYSGWAALVVVGFPFLFGFV